MTTTTEALEIAQAIFQKYYDRYDGEVQGCCPLIADEINKAVGGDVVAGELTWYGGMSRRTHWWVDLDGTRVDPMGTWFLAMEEGPGWTEVHRDRWEFDAILPQYEQWRVEDVPAPRMG